MKKLKLFILAFVIGTMNLFATQISKDFPLIKDTIIPNNTIIIKDKDFTIIIKDKDFKSSAKKMLTNSKMLSNNLINVNISFTYNLDGKIVIQEMQSKNYDFLISILETLNNERRISAIRAYAYEMPSIMRKE